MRQLRDYIEANGVEEGIDFDARYTVTGRSGVAWSLLGWGQTWEPYYIFFEAEEGLEEEWIEDGGEWVADTGQVVACMVGDDMHFTFDRDDITVIPDDSYCGGCGQIGCKAYG